MKTIRFKFTGLRPLLMHNGRLSDPMDKHALALKKACAKGSKMTESDHRERDRLEWLGGLYWSEELGGIAIPSDNIEACLQGGAALSKRKKSFQAGVLVSEHEVAVHHRMSGKSPEEMLANPAYTLRVGTKLNGKTRITRVRPMLPPGWTIQFTVEFEPSIVNESAVIEAATDAGAIVGLGDWRPKFGRFSVEVVR